MRQPEITAAQIVGGTVKVNPMSLCIAWGMLLAERIEHRQFRVWLALHEMREERDPKFSKKYRRTADWTPFYTWKQLAQMVGMSEAAARTCVRVLERRGLVRWSETKIEIATHTDAVGEGVPQQVWDMWCAWPEKGMRADKKKLNVPRRLLRWLARGESRATIGVALAECLHCLFFYKGKGWATRGRLLASVNAELFGIGVRSVKRARATLVERRVLIPRECQGQWDRNKYGSNFELNAWAAFTDGELTENDRLAGELFELSTADVARPQSEPTSNLARPLDQPLPSKKESKNQTLRESPAAPRTPALVSSRKVGGGTTPKTVTFFDVTDENLKDGAQLLELFEHATKLGFVAGSQMDEVNFFAAAARARRVAAASKGASSATAVFCGIVRGCKWGNITQGEEDQASAMLKAVREGITVSQKRKRSWTYGGEDDEFAPRDYVASLTGIVSSVLESAGTAS